MERVLQADALAYTMDEVRVEDGAELAGKTLQQSNFRQQFDAIVVAVMDGRTLRMSFNPGPQQAIQAGDTLIVMGSVEMIARLKKDGCTSKNA